MRIALRVVLVGLAFIALVGLAFFVVSNEAMSVSTLGTLSCDKWLSDRDAQKQGAAITEQVWIVGYLSGLAVGGGRNFWNKSSADELTPDAVFLWVDNYCSVNPQEGLAEAGHVLFT